MIVDSAVYTEGLRLPEALSTEEAYVLAQKPDSFLWMGLLEPSEGEFETMRRIFDLHELAAEDAVSAHQRPKLEVYDENLLVVLKTARYLDAVEEVEFGEILLVTGESFILVVRHGQASGLQTVRRDLESRPDLLRYGPSAVLHGIMDRVVDDYIPVVDGLGNDIEEVEKEVFSSARTNPAERIYFLMREVLEFNQATRSLIDPLSRLVRGHFDAVDPEIREYFRDVYDHVVRINEQLAAYRDLLTSILEANLTQVGVRQNEDMRKISAWVAMAAVPTAIAGIYGMNFLEMPGLRSPWGFPIVVAFMLAVSLFLYRQFRRSGWL